MSISVIMSVYNGERYLASAIESILCQSFKDFELLITDDGSSDASLKIVKEYVAQDSRVKLETHENRGLVNCRNEGIARAQYQYIALMDADDIALAHRFDIQKNFLDSNPDCVALASRVMLVDPDGSDLMPFGKPFDSSSCESAKFINNYGIMNPTFIFRATALSKVGPYRKEFLHAEDVDMTLRMLEVGRVVVLPDILLKYRQHAESIGYRHRTLQRDAAMRAYQDASRRGRLKIEIAPRNVNVETASKAEIYRKWAWWALEGGNVKTSRKHALQSFLLKPFDPESWRALYCSLRGR